MPRLNIETKLYSDPRFQNFMIKIGDRHRAIGMVVELWQLAQKYWWPERQLIPLDVWATSGLPETLIECGLAEKRSAGVYAKGAEEHFSWWFERQAAGRKGGLSSVESRKRLAKQSLSSAQAGSSTGKQMEPSPSLSSSSSEKKDIFVRSGGEEEYTEEFELTYSQYPRKEGKAKGYALYLDLSEAERKQLPLAISNYASQCRQQERELKHVKLFSSFMADGFWKDHLTRVTSPQLSDWHGGGTWEEIKRPAPTPSEPSPQRKEE